MLLAPRQSTLRAIDSDGQRVLVAGRDLACPEQATRAIGIAQHDLGIVVERATWHEGAEFRAERAHGDAGDVVGEIVGVRADVADAASRAGALRVGAPAGLLLATVLQPGCQPVLCVFDLHDADVTQFACLDHRARMPHHGIAGVIMRHRENQA